MIKIKIEEYGPLVSKTSKGSPTLRDTALAFLVGGCICTVGQGLLAFYGEVLQMEKEDAGIYVSITLVFLSAFLTGIGIYDKIAKIGGAGTLVPITGFANAMVSPAMEFKTEGLITGLGAKIFIIAGPVLVYGTAASFIYGIIYYTLTKLT